MFASLKGPQRPSAAEGGGIAFGDEYEVSVTEYFSTPS
jgi:hypothetical protein